MRPDRYPIWDSRIQSHHANSRNPYGMKYPEKYLAYCSLVHEYVHMPELLPVLSSIAEKIRAGYDYDISPVRAIEYAIFAQKRALTSQVTTESVEQ